MLGRDGSEHDFRLQELPDNCLSRALLAWPERPALALLRALEGRLYPSSIPHPVLDIGCGNGKFATVIDLRGAIGLDADAHDLELARGRRVYSALIHADARTIPLHDGAVRCIISNSTLEHIPDDRAVVREAARVLAAGGRFIFSVPSEYKEQTLFFGDPAFVEDELASAEYRRLFTAEMRHYHYRSLDEWAAILTDVGLSVVSVVRYETRVSGYIGDVLGYAKISIEAPSVVRQTAVPRRLFVRIMYDALEDYWIADEGGSVNAEVTGGVLIIATKV
ncbi:class I SAM-dependent methyltransferase [Actinosynnema sp. CA-299493]